jgi:hypothetical protein
MCTKAYNCMCVPMQWCAVLKENIVKVMAQVFQVLLRLCSTWESTGGDGGSIHLCPGDYLCFESHC